MFRTDEVRIVVLTSSSSSFKWFNEPIGRLEFEKLKNQIESAFVSTNSTVAGIAESLANYHTYYGNANLINTEIERYMKVTREDLRNAARKYYIPENRVVLYFLNDPKLSAN